MSQPKFKIGEEVILQSNNYPELNGLCTVLSVSPFDGLTRGRNGTYVKGEAFSYLTTIECPSGLQWNQIALRKKPKLSDDDFSSLMDKLKTGNLTPLKIPEHV